jgi:hypothetical protein
MLEEYVRARSRPGRIALMTHIVVGYPSLDASMRIVETMVNAGVDLMELQIPFSEPIADGPVILRANAEALAAGSTVQRCLDFASAVSQRFDVPFVFVAYYNTLNRFGIRNFVREMAARGVRGAIVPDLPPEEGAEYLAAMSEAGLAPILLFSPTTTPDRLQYLGHRRRDLVFRRARGRSCSLPRCHAAPARGGLRREGAERRRLPDRQGRHRDRRQPRAARDRRAGRRSGRAVREVAARLSVRSFATARRRVR